MWWEIETPAPEVFQRFHAAMWGWVFEPAFAGGELAGIRRPVTQAVAVVRA